MGDSATSSALSEAVVAIRRAQLRGHNSVLTPALFGGSVLGSVLVFALWNKVSHQAIAEWAAVLAFALIARAMVGFSCRRVADRLRDAELNAWLWKIRVTYFLHGAAWGFAAWHVFPPDDIPRQIILAFAVTTVAVGSLSIAAFDLIGASSFALPALAPLIAKLLLSGGEVNAFISFLIVLFLGYVRMSALRAHGNATENALLRIAEESRTRAIVRQKEAFAIDQKLTFALERSELERQALDARLHLLQAQVAPHFLFNTLANVQALVDAGSPHASAVLRSLTAYLRAAVPLLHESAATIERELQLVQPYLELMQMRMPDRDRQVRRRVLLRLDTLGARRARGRHLPPLGARAVEPATGPAEIAVDAAGTGQGAGVRGRLSCGPTCAASTTGHA